MADRNEDSTFDPETITLLASVLERSWDALPSEQQTKTTRAKIAEYILTLAAHGEHNVTRLFDSVLAQFTKS